MILFPKENLFVQWKYGKAKHCSAGEVTAPTKGHVFSIVQSAVLFPQLAR